MKKIWILSFILIHSFYSHLFGARDAYPIYQHEKDYATMATISDRICIYAKLGLLEKVKECIEQDPQSVNLIEKVSLDTPLHYAANKGHTDIVKLLMSHGANINTKNKSGETPLHHAQNKDIAKLLLDAGANINEINSDNETPLISVIRSDNPDVATYLIDQGADVTIQTDEKNTALQWAALYNQVEVAQKLIEKGADVSIQNDPWGYTPLHYAAIGGYENFAKLLLANKADINARSTWDFNTPLHEALLKKRTNLAKTLIEKGASINKPNKYKQTPLHFAELHDLPEIVDLLKTKGANVNAKDSEGKTPQNIAQAREEQKRKKEQQKKEEREAEEKKRKQQDEQNKKEKDERARQEREKAEQAKKAQPDAEEETKREDEEQRLIHEAEKKKRQEQEEAERLKKEKKQEGKDHKEREGKEEEQRNKIRTWIKVRNRLLTTATKDRSFPRETSEPLYQKLEVISNEINNKSLAELEQLQKEFSAAFTQAKKDFPDLREEKKKEMKDWIDQQQKIINDYKNTYHDPLSRVFGRVSPHPSVERLADDLLYINNAVHSGRLTEAEQLKANFQKSHDTIKEELDNEKKEKDKADRKLKADRERKEREDEEQRLIREAEKKKRQEQEAAQKRKEAEEKAQYEAAFKWISEQEKRLAELEKKNQNPANTFKLERLKLKLADMKKNIANHDIETLEASQNDLMNQINTAEKNIEQQPPRSSTTLLTRSALVIGLIETFLVWKKYQQLQHDAEEAKQEQEQKTDVYDIKKPQDKKNQADVKKEAIEPTLINAIKASLAEQISYLLYPITCWAKKDAVEPQEKQGI